MAYNPFDFFRRNQKTFFSVLVVFIMFMFVLSFGQGDVFTWLPQWLSSRRGGGDVMATVDGSKVYSSELERLQQGRVLANEFMRESSRVAASNLANSLSEGMGAASDDTKRAVQRLLTARLQRIPYVDDQLAFLYVRQLGRDLRQSDLVNLQAMTIDTLTRQFQAVLTASPAANPNDPPLAKAAQELVVLDAVIAQAANPAVGYFANQPQSDKPKDALEFALWLRKADDLGISISASDAAAMYDREFLRQVTKQDAALIERAVLGHRSQVRTSLDEALANEFKVRAAQAVVLGPAYGRPAADATQAFVAPYEGYQFYRGQVVAGAYTILGVPAENYLNNVPGEPTETEVRELFQKYRDKEPNPLVETPGFREPRKLKLGWLEATGEEPFYAKAAADYLSHAEAAAKAAYLVAGGTGWTALGGAAAANLQDPSLGAAYEAYKGQFESKLRTAWYSVSPSVFNSQEVLDTSVVKPTTLATAVGLAAAATRGTAFTPMLALSERAKADDRIARARVFATLLSPASPAGTNVLGTALAAGVRVPAPLPLAVVRTQLIDQVRKEATARVVQADLFRFTTEAAKLGAKKDRSEARAFVGAFAAERKLKLGGSEQARDVYAIEDDPGLKPLRDKLDRGHARLTEVPGTFGQPFFYEQDPRTGAVVAAKAFFDPQPYPQGSMLAPRENEPTALAWRTDEVPAETPKSIDDKVRPKVVAAWKRIKARELAKQAADDLAKGIRETLGKTPGGDQYVVIDQVVRDAHTKFANAQDGLEESARVGYVLEQNVAPFPDRPASTAIGMSQAYAPYSLAASKAIPYPTPAMVTELVENKDKPLGTVLRFADPAKDRQYVAVLVNRNERDSATFLEQAYKVSVFSGQSELFGAIRERQRDAARKQAREQAVALLKAEYKVANENPKLNGDDKKGEGA